MLDRTRGQKKKKKYLSDFDDVDDDFEYDGHSYSFKREYTDEELLERRLQEQREEQLCCGGTRR